MFDSSNDLLVFDDISGLSDWSKAPTSNPPQKVTMEVCRSPYNLGCTIETINVLDIFFKDFESCQSVCIQSQKRKVKIKKNHRKFSSWRKAKKYAKTHGLDLFETPMILIPKAKVTVKNGNVEIVAKENG